MSVSSSLSRPTLLFLDWDSTLTTASTLPLIASIATYPVQHPELHDLAKAYAEDLRVHNASYLPAESSRTTLEQEIAYLNSLSTVEETSIRRIENAGIFNDVEAEDVKHVAAQAVNRGDVKLRNDWQRCLQSVKRNEGDEINGQVCIISVAWSGLFIRACLEAAMEHDSIDTPSVNDLQQRLHNTHPSIKTKDISIYANDIHLSDAGKLTGPRQDLNRPLLTAGDKSEIMRTFILGFRETSPAVETRTVYIGDSPTDLTCLIDADVGICIRDVETSGEQKELAVTLQRLGAVVKWVGEFPRDNPMSGVDEEGSSEVQTLWWARDFFEIMQSEILD